MNYTFDTKVGDGTTTSFTFGFVGPDEGYVDLRRDLRVFVNGVAVAFTTSFADPNKVFINPAPAAGSSILIRRIMPRNQPYTDFKGGNAFTPSNLNYTALQQLYLTQEILDGFYDPDFYFKQDINMGGHKLVNLTHGTASGHSVNWDQLKAVDDKHTNWNTAQDQEIAALKEGMVSDVSLRTVPWLHIASGGELVIAPPFRFSSAWVWRDGVMQYQLDGAFTIVNSTIVFPSSDPLRVGERVLIAMGSAANSPDDKPSVTEVAAMIDTLRQEIDEGNGSGVGYVDLLGNGYSLKSYLDEGSILVRSREELLAAVAFANATQRRCEVRLAQNFAPWTAPTTDIDMTHICLRGSGAGTRINATGIPNVDGNYFIRFHSSSLANINGVAYLTGDNISGITVTGPGRSSLVKGFWWDDATNSISHLNIRGLVASEFGTGFTVGRNAYILHFFGCRIDRCGVHLHMPVASNSGEGIHFYGGTIGTSAGIGVLQQNFNGALRCFGTSLDYMGAFVRVEAGSVELMGCHMEGENGTNDFNQIPFYVGSHQTSRLIIDGGELLSHKGINPITQTHVFSVQSGGIGATIRNLKMSAMVTTSGEMNTGTGVFNLTGVQLLDGSGNPSVSQRLSPTQSQFVDGSMAGTSVHDWYLSTATAATSRVASDSANITMDETVAYNGLPRSVKVNKLTAGGTPLIVGALFPVEAFCNTSLSLQVMASASAQGVMVVGYEYFGLTHYDSLGRPQGRTGTFRSRNVDAATTKTWTRVSGFSVRDPAPAWATHVRVTLNMINLNSTNSWWIGMAEGYSL